MICLWKKYLQIRWRYVKLDSYYTYPSIMEVRLDETLAKKETKRSKKYTENTAIKNSKFLRVLKSKTTAWKKTEKKQAPKRDVQSMLRYEKMFESGICELSTNYYSKSIQFSDINYQIASKEEQQGILLNTAHC